MMNQSGSDHDVIYLYWVSVESDRYIGTRDVKF